MSMFDYVATYNDLLPKSTCKKIIKKFEECSEHQQQTYLKDHRSFTEINIMHHPDWNDIRDEVFRAMQFGLGMYIRDFKIDEKSWPEQLGYEQIRIKRYLPDTEDEFHFHVDVQDYASARRFLAFFFYLNDVDENGGPFCIVEESHRVKFDGCYDKYRWSTDEINTIYGEEKVKYLTANVGDLIIANTTAFHRGTKPISSDRTMITLDWVIHPEFFSNPEFKIAKSKFDNMPDWKKPVLDYLIKV